eukprot:g22633.t1
MVGKDKGNPIAVAGGTILNHNIFTFNNQFFTQTHGTAMGTKFAPQYINIFMDKFSKTSLLHRTSNQCYTPDTLTTFSSFGLRTIVRRKLPRIQDNIDHHTTEPCRGNRCKTCPVINMDTTITSGTPPTTCTADTH